MCHVQQIAPTPRKKGSNLLVLDTLILFQVAYFRQTNIQNFPWEHAQDPPNGSRLRRSVAAGDHTNGWSEDIKWSTLYQQHN